MLFNSDVFLKFFAAFVLFYWLVRHRLAARNVLVVTASLLFYFWWVVDREILFQGWYDWRFLALLLFTCLLDFSVGLGLDGLSGARPRKLLLGASVVGNLGILGFFKYHGFFVTSVAGALANLGVTVELPTLKVILPAGISFYTFQSMSYTIDVYRRELPATRRLSTFLAYVTFFPQLVAGPIERAARLLPQFERPRVITRAMLEEGVWLMLWGMFKKVALADNFAPLTDLVFNQPHFSAPMVVGGVLAFALQIYCDFSGYSDIARGVARVLGFELMVNFNVPYAATSVRDFWRRWHISLSTWLRDYLYIPLGGNRRGPARTYGNLLVTMLLGGLWHGAAWNFVLWGAWHGLGLALNRAAIFDFQFSMLSSKLRRAISWLGTMLFILYGWLLFRAGSWEQIAAMTRALGEFTAPPWLGSFGINLLVFATPLVLMEIWQEKSGNPLAPLALPAWAKAALQGALLLGIVLFWKRGGSPFIYFQF